MDSKPTIGIVGLSHLGIIWSVGYAALGFKVIAYDSDVEAVDSLGRGILPIPEPGLPEQFAEARPRLTFTRDPRALNGCAAVFFARDVPYDEEGRIDLAPIEFLLDSAIPHLSSNVEFIFMGQVPVGYTRRLGSRIRSRLPARPFTLIYRVETLTIGQAVADFLKPDRLILGLEDPGKGLSELALSVLQKPFGCPLVIGSFESAELTKSAINIYLANAVTFVNTISDLCEKVGANIQEVTAAMKLDRRFSPLCYWRPGLGFAGGHLERDLTSLTKLSLEHGIEPRLLQTIVRNSKERYQWLVRKLEDHVFRLNPAPTLCLWGLAYKKGTDSLHNAHCLKIFRDFGTRARFRVYDPVARLPHSISGVETFSDKFEALRGSDAVILLTEWDEFRVDDPRPFLERMKRPFLIDGVQIVDAKVSQDRRIEYRAMGIPTGGIPKT